MSTLAKAFVVINLLLGVMFLSVSCVLFSQQESWKAKYNGAVQELKDLGKDYTGKINKANDMLAKRSEKIADLEHQLNDAKEEADSLRAELKVAQDNLRNEQKKNTDLALNLTKLSSSLETAQNDLATARAMYEAEKSKFEKADEERMAKAAEVIKLAEIISDHEATIASLKETIDRKNDDIEQVKTELAWYKKKAPDLVYDGRGHVPPPIDAKVEGVDLENGFVILSVGAEDRVKRGYTFVVYRDTSYIGQVEVDRVYPTKCSARIDPRMTRATIQVGDEAKTDLGT